ncbi:MAG TPA: type II toxin-antitoxin system prevent-host-death family antitoxin [Thermoanaerobaculia bacterium]|jgi:prevent-host-death family protein|nr:type II toxin-antitoxin system prevent-host-death family antitoxin [Thermoanaerobaculia bacterium]
MNWSVAEAKQRFSEVVRATQEGPQLIYNRGKLVAGVVPAEYLQEFLSWREQKEGPSIADAFGELRRICAEEGYEIELPAREDRANLFANDLP